MNASTGSVMIVAAAASPPQSTCSYDRKLNTATGTVRVVGPARISAKRKLFQEKMNDSTAVATTPLRAMGSATYRNDSGREQPSISAASSISCGMSSKNPIISHTASGSEM